MLVHSGTLKRQRKAPLCLSFARPRAGRIRGLSRLWRLHVAQISGTLL